MANYLITNQPQVFNGLGTLTYTVPTTGNYNVQYQVTVPEAVATGDGAGSGQGLGSGVGGGKLAQFSLGGGGTSDGSVGQGFGSDSSGYNQPPSYGSNATSGAAVSSGVSVVVKQNGSTIYTMPSLTATQSAAQFKYSFQATAADSITVVIASSTASDEGLNGVQSIVSVGQGF